VSASTNFKRRGLVSCSRGHHLHRTAEEARICEAAWRLVLRKRLQVDELIEQLRAVVFKGRPPGA
jgi:hypothetical protein